MERGRHGESEALPGLRVQAKCPAAGRGWPLREEVGEQLEWVFVARLLVVLGALSPLPGESLLCELQEGCMTAVPRQVRVRERPPCLCCFPRPAAQSASHGACVGGAP